MNIFYKIYLLLTNRTLYKLYKKWEWDAEIDEWIESITPKEGAKPLKNITKASD